MPGPAAEARGQAGEQDAGDQRDRRQHAEPRGQQRPDGERPGADVELVRGAAECPPHAPRPLVRVLLALVDLLLDPVLGRITTGQSGTKWASAAPR